jgi:hypothetical protein
MQCIAVYAAGVYVYLFKIRYEIEIFILDTYRLDTVARMWR